MRSSSGSVSSVSEFALSGSNFDDVNHILDMSQAPTSLRNLTALTASLVLSLFYAARKPPMGTATSD